MSVKAGQAHFDVLGADFRAVVNGTGYPPGNGSTFVGGYLEPGESISGTLVYDVPAAHGKIGFTPYKSGQEIAWRFPASGTGT
jgi:hypothetical protein